MNQSLKKINACDKAIEWVDKKDPQTAWETCERGDWMLWLAQKASLCDLKTLTLMKVETAELVKHLMKDERSLNALKVARDFAEGNATREELDAAYAAADAAAYAAAAYADAEILLKSANICRKILPNPNWEKAIKEA